MLGLGKKSKAEKAKREREKREAAERAAAAEKAKREREEREAAERGTAAEKAVSVERSAATGNGGPVVGDAPGRDLAAEAETETEMRRKLQDALGRPIILIKEPLKDRAWHTAIKHERGAYGLGLLGLVVATALTHGTAAVVLTACSSSIPLLDFETFFDNKKVAYNKGVILDQGAIDALRKISESERAGIAQAAIDMKGSVDGRVLLTGADIEEEVRKIEEEARKIEEARKAAIAARQSALSTDAGPGPVQIGVRMGLAVAGSGLLLLALSIIPEDIQTLMTRVASLVLVVGVLIISGALANGSWLKGRDRRN
jgi:hypothetical protein